MSRLVLCLSLALAPPLQAQDGYDVVLDGVVGPWFLPVIAREIVPSGVPVSYVVLRVHLDEALRRTSARTPPSDKRVVAQMNEAFFGLGEYERHAIDTSERSIEDVVDEIRSRREMLVLDSGGLQREIRPTPR